MPLVFRIFKKSGVVGVGLKDTQSELKPVMLAGKEGSDSLKSIWILINLSVQLSLEFLVGATCPSPEWPQAVKLDSAAGSPGLIHIFWNYL
jgi:hypothetical protein